ncbi:XkdN-like protein [Vallitalea pronyensis]|uniref:XkdN-like protein n=1 Tax=Vallitalea pronyensis TaxID=1348613 RepID=A0A8J8MPD0_9FIRM|nr:hypothetical protein [Vallitalea pronyensis]QUI25520.1 XkdN-like protein [Vallitalea pronyensis]
MSQLQAFLNNHVVEDIQADVFVSKRFKDEKGELLQFKIRAITDSQMSEIQKICMRTGKKGKVDFDVSKFNRLIAIKGSVEPQFEDAQSIKSVGCVTPEDYIKKVMLPGEIATLAEQIQTLSGYTDLEDLKEQAKN